MENPNVMIGEWVMWGSHSLDAYVLRVISETEIYAGYYQNNLKAIGEYFIWDGQAWVLKYQTPDGSYLRGEEAAIVKRGPYSRK